ncbi:MAG: glycosyltransferase [Bacteroidaceae bacterium]|nr:glycosyltransferase [Bacteroidaceae bacterium]MBR3896327.1 glycosyltransferase [Bacteroidaceae bacterium]
MILSIVIVAYNSNDVLLDCLDSIKKVNPYSDQLEVIIVDNNPPSGLSTLLKEQIYDFQLIYMPNDKNVGFGAANNQGCDLARSKVVLFLNPDTLIVEDIFTPTIKAIESDIDTVVGYRLIDVKGSPNNSYSYFFEYFYLFPLFHLVERFSFFYVNDWRVVNRIVWPWGAAFAMNRDKFVEAGKFDENIFLCNEEQDLMKRVVNRKIKILSHRIVHLEGHGQVVSVRRYKAYFESLHYYFKKYNLSATSFWCFFRMKIKIKQLIGSDVSQYNLVQAFTTFQKEVLNNKSKG